MAGKGVVYVTCGNSREARKIGRTLVEKRLAACVNFLDPVRSFYRSQGEICHDPVVLLVIQVFTARLSRSPQRGKETPTLPGARSHLPSGQGGFGQLPGLAIRLGWGDPKATLGLGPGRQ